MARAGGKKVPKTGAQTSGVRTPVARAQIPQTKRPIQGAAVGDDDTYIVFRLRFIDHSGPWGWTAVPSTHWEKILAKFTACEGMRPSEVFGVGKNKQIPTESLCQQAQNRLAELELDDQELWELHVTGKMRIWGIRRSHIFYVVWWDPEHEVCPSAKRNT